jgi:hypothetical protein
MRALEQGMSGARFHVMKDDFGGWVAEGARSVPLASLTGAAAPATTASATTTTGNNRPAELQLRILREEILLRFAAIEVVGPTRRVLSDFVRGCTELPVRIPL